MAHYLCHQHGTGIYAPELLLRTRATQSQGGLSRQARKRNLAGAFAVSPGATVAGQTVILIDDVMTTGATLNAAAGVLHRAGAAEVRALTIARVI